MAAAVSSGTHNPPPAAAFFAPVDLSSSALLRLLVSVAGDLIAAHSGRGGSPRHQRRNRRRLVRRIEVLHHLFESLSDARRPLPRLAVLCLNELYIVVHRARILLDYCSHSSRLWLILRNTQISVYFHDLDREISTLLEVIPLNELDLAADVREHLELLRRQVGNSKLCVDSRDEELRIQILSLLNEFESQRLPESSALQSTFTDKIGIFEARDFDLEMEFLEEKINNHKDATEDDAGTIGGVIALARYCRILLFGTQDAIKGMKRFRNRQPPAGEIPGANFTSAPKDFCCPISLELMRDPVVVSTGQTYDRGSIVRWMDGGHRTCPNSGQTLGNAGLVPNNAVRSLISHWCTANRIPCNELVTPAGGSAPATKAALEINRATIRILIRHLSTGEEDSKAVASRELRMLAKIAKENRIIIAEEGAIPFLCCLLHSPNPIAQENAVTSLLNISIHDTNKAMIMREEGCLSSIVGVLRHGLTPDARENAGATLFSLSSVHEYKKSIVEERGAAEALAWLLRRGSERGRKDAAMALFNLATHPESWERMVGSGAVAAVVAALVDEGVAEEAAGALALLARQPIVAGMVGWEERAVVGLASVMRAGSARGRENAAAALHEICRRGGEVVAERVARVPGVAGVIQTVALAGTKRARRKAAALARMLQTPAPLRPPAFVPLRGRGWAVESGGDMSTVAVPAAISVPVP